MKRISCLSLILLTIMIVLVGCSGITEKNKNAENKVNNVGKMTEITTGQNKQMGKDTTKSLTKSEKDSSTIEKDTNYLKWNGNWNMGEENKTGASASLSIDNANKKQFKFSIDAAFVSTIVKDDGSKYLNPHEGSVDEGIAFFTSSKDAYYTTEEYPDYKMIFKIEDDNVINIEEINIKTGRDYGESPFAGMNVRYFGTYTKNK